MEGRIEEAAGHLEESTEGAAKGRPEKALTLWELLETERNTESGETVPKEDSLSELSLDSQKCIITL